MTSQQFKYAPYLVLADTSNCLQAPRNVGLMPSLAKPVLLAANNFADKLTNVACDVVPDTIERGTVRLPEACALPVCISSFAKPA